MPEVKLQVVMPGPWWTTLTYRSQQNIAPGIRVKVPVGQGQRVGLVLGGKAGDSYGGTLRDIDSQLDSTTLLAPDTVKLVEWLCATHFCGPGSALKALLPSLFLKGELPDKKYPEQVPPQPLPDRATTSKSRFIYDTSDRVRYEKYADLLTDERPTLICFPTHTAAAAFYSLLPDETRERTLLYPKSGAKAEWRAWSSLLATDKSRHVVAAQAGSVVPLRGLARIVVEDESNNVWRTMRAPFYNVRSLLAKRAALTGSELVLGGRMPSVRVYMQMEREGIDRYAPDRASRKITFVDLRRAYAPAVAGVADNLAVSEPLVRETESALNAGKWAIWILDRKGYAGELYCDECGSSPKCPKCGSPMRWEAAGERLACVNCRAALPIPDRCPHCGGGLMSARRPGLEALEVLAHSAVNAPVPIISQTDEEDKIGNEPGAGLVLGTRAALSLCDRLPVGMIGWLDADGEARSQDHGARARAFGLIWESCYRGIDTGPRKILVQSRQAGREWQSALESGWHYFWKNELRERADYSMPPLLSLIKIESTSADIKSILSAVAANPAFESWAPDAAEGKPTLWIRTKRINELRKILSPYFDISRAKRGFPAVTVWHD